MNRYTSDEWIAIVQSLIEWARVVRKRYDREECECCGIAYHPRDGEPPDESVCGKDEDSCYCGHAGFRRMYGEWNYDADDWYDW